MTHLLINGVFLGVIIHLLTFDPNFLGYESGKGQKLLVRKCGQRNKSQKLLVRKRGCRFVPSRLLETKPQMVPRDLNWFPGFGGLIQGQIYNA